MLRQFPHRTRGRPAREQHPGYLLVVQHPLELAHVSDRDAAALDRTDGGQPAFQQDPLREFGTPSLGIVQPPGNAPFPGRAPWPHRRRRAAARRTNPRGASPGSGRAALAAVATSVAMRASSCSLVPVPRPLTDFMCRWPFRPTTRARYPARARDRPPNVRGPHPIDLENVDLENRDRFPRPALRA